MNHMNGVHAAVAVLAVAGILFSAPGHAQRAPAIEGLDRIERIDLQGMALSRYRATGESALGEEQVHRFGRAVGGDELRVARILQKRLKQPHGHRRIVDDHDLCVLDAGDDACGSRAWGEHAGNGTGAFRLC